jgi:YidC/Oxa1 family membrane protein insertase
MKINKVALALIALCSTVALSGGAFANVATQWVKTRTVERDVQNADGTTTRQVQQQPIDLDGDGKPEVVAVTNLQDIAFNERGELVGWYDKLFKGTDFRSDYNNKSNLMQTGLPGAVVTLPGISGPITASAPVTTLEPGTDILRATFSYTQDGARVEKKYVILPRRLLVTLELSVNGVPNYTLQWRGLGGSPRTATKVAAVGATSPIEIGSAQNAQYAALQCCNNFLGAPGQAMVVKPQPGSNTTFAASVETKTVQRRDAQGVTAPLEVSAMTLTLPSGTSNLNLYGGYNELVRLNQEGFAQLPGLFQPNIFGQLSLAIVRLLEWIHGFVGNWGLTIILLTVLVRLALIPLLQTQYRSMAEMQVIQPLIKEIQTKYKEDPAKLQQETMKLYQEHGVNPFAGCLPVLLQMPIFLVLWRVFSNYEFGEPFLWLRDLSLPDALYILPVLYLGSSMLQLWLSTRANPDMFRQQMIIQFIFAYVFLSFPSGVTMYGVIGNLIGVAQQYLITKRTEAYMAAKGKPVILGAKPVAATSTSGAPPTVDAKAKPKPKKQ